MPLKIIHPQYTEVMGRGLVLLSSPQVKGPRNDLYTGQIVEEAALLSKSWAIIASENTQDQEQDKAGLAESNFDQSLQNFVGEYGIKCIIVVSGMSEPGITIKGRRDESSSEEILEIIRTGLEPHFKINSNPERLAEGLADSPVTSQAAENVSNHSLTMPQVELGPDERGFMKDRIVSSMADIVGLINSKLGFSETDERGSSVLD